MLGATQLKSSFAEKVLVDTMLNVIQQRALATKKDNHVFPGLHREDYTRSKEVILPLSSVLVKPHLDNYIQF